jgi:hypothetical protein
MHRVPGISQSAVDRFDVILGPRHDDQWNGTRFAHLENPRKLGAKCTTLDFRYSGTGVYTGAGIRV